MKFVIQRVTNASCTVEGNITGSIQKGFSCPYRNIRSGYHTDCR